tara:strand:- start:448 stop:1194 length:747 start_codon:yes stop_codon:yes gene_type:complete
MKDVMYLDIETDRLLRDTGVTEKPLSVRSGAEKWSEYLDAARRLRMTVGVTLMNGHMTFYAAEGFEEAQQSGGLRQAAEECGAELVIGARALARAMHEAPAICVWNAAFDLQVMSSYAPVDSQMQWCEGWCKRTQDPMAELMRRTGQMYKMSDVARLTMPDLQKTADGTAAVDMFERGQWGDLVRYCAQDVRVLQGLDDSSELVVPLRREEPLRPLAATSLKRKYSDTREAGSQTQHCERESSRFVFD